GNSTQERSYTLPIQHHQLGTPNLLLTLKLANGISSSSHLVTLIVYDCLPPHLIIHNCTGPTQMSQ
ncbi:hypothetical protein STEG23_034107, partial [Scotinomys teguina]